MIIKTPKNPMDLRAIKRIFDEYDRGELIYIPVGAEKGDCPYCKVSLYKSDEEYVCPTCKSVFIELARRYFINKELK